MIKTSVIVLIFFLGSLGFAQGKYLTRTGDVSFEASVPSFEEVKAKNEAVTAILNSDNGEFASLILVKGFRFKNALMEEHFNENYAESDRFPKATFKGNLEAFSSSSLTKTMTKHAIKGELTFHGKTESIKVSEVFLKKDGDTITMNGTFAVHVSDFNIDIPGVVSNKISKTVDVKFKFNLIKK